MLKAIFFDFDGVIVESNQVKKESFLEIFKSYSSSYDEILKYEEKCGPLSRFDKVRDIRKILNIDDDAIEEKWLNKYKDLTIKNVINADYVNGSIEFLEFLHGKYKLFLLSNTPLDDLLEIVHEKDIAHFFDDIFGSPVVKAEILMDYKIKHNYQNSEILFIGDNLTDLSAGLDAEVMFIGRYSGVDFPEEVEVVKDMEDLRKNWHKYE